MFCLHKTPIWRENSLSFLGGLRSFLPNPQSRFPEGPLSLFKKNFLQAGHTPDGELAAQLSASSLTREHQKAAGLALLSLLLFSQPRGASGFGWGVGEAAEEAGGAREGRGVPPGSAHGAAPGPPCFLEQCSFDPSGSPCHCTARAPSGSPRPRSSSSPPSLACSLSPDRGCSGPPPPLRPVAPHFFPLSPRPCPAARPPGSKVLARPRPSPPLCAPPASSGRFGDGSPALRALKASPKNRSAAGAR